jgi:ankyrin repeat protein
LTTLDLIVAGNNDKLVALLLDHPQVNVNLRGLDGYTALIRASGDRADYVAMLLSNPDIDPNLATYFGTTALTYAIR